MRYLQCLVLACLVSAALCSPGSEAVQNRKRGEGAQAVALNSLLLMVQQQSSKIDKLGTDLAGYKNQVVSYKTQVEEMRHQMDDASKSVYFTAHMTTGPVMMGQHSPLRFDGIVTNIGGGYNPHTGVFTAPVPGVYVFYAQIMKYQNTGAFKWAIHKSGTTLCGNYVNDSNVYDKSSCLATVRLQKGDTVFVRRMNLKDPGYTLEGWWWCSFSGYLSSVEA